MPRTTRRPGPPTLMFGVWGQGETTPENIDALLSDYIDGQGEVTPKFLLPIDKDITSDAILDVAAYAQDKGYEIEVVQVAPPRTKALREAAADAKVHEAEEIEAIAEVMAEVLGKADDARLLFLWAEEDGEPLREDQEALFTFVDAGIEALDLTSGLDVIDVEGGDEPAPEPEPEPEKPARGRGRAAAKEEPEPEPAADDEPSEDEVREYPIRRLRTYVKDNYDDVPDDLAKMDKDAILDWLFPAEDGGEEPEPEPAKEETSRQRAARIRKEVEAEGKAPNEASVRKARASAKSDDEPADEAQATVKGTASGEIPGDLVREIVKELGDLLADTIIDRIAARIEAEPEDSATRQEIAPKRPPGRPRTDGAAPTRRRRTS